MPTLKKKKKAQKQTKRSTTKRYQPFWRSVYGARCPVKRFKISLLDGFNEPEHTEKYNSYPCPWKLAEQDERKLDIYKD